MFTISCIIILKTFNNIVIIFLKNIIIIFMLEVVTRIYKIIILRIRYRVILFESNSSVYKHIWHSTFKSFIKEKYWSHFKVKIIYFCIHEDHNEYFLYRISIISKTYINIDFFVDFITVIIFHCWWNTSIWK